MVLQKGSIKAYEDFIKEDLELLFVSGSNVSLQEEDEETFVLSTPIYFGADYLPKSVREAAKKTPPFNLHQTLLTSIQIDEEQFRVYLTYSGASLDLAPEKFKVILSEFDYLAGEWRIYLDEHEKKDLVWVRK